MWIIDPTSQTETRVNIIEIVNEDTEERITVVTKDASKIIQLIQPRFVKTIANDRVYIMDNSDELIGIGVKDADKFTTYDEKELQKWLTYLNSIDELTSKIKSAVHKGVIDSFKLPNDFFEDDKND